MQDVSRSPKTGTLAGSPAPHDAAPPPAAGPAALSAERQAALIRDGLFAAIMTGSVGFGSLDDSAGFQLYIDRFLCEAGSPADPVERMLLLQLSLGHYRIGMLHYKSATASDVHVAQAYNSAAVQLMGEYRRGALALSAYRAAARRPEDAASPAKKEGHPSELAKQAEADHGGELRLHERPEPGAAGQAA
jgi:hypothetical protein